MPWRFDGSAIDATGIQFRMLNRRKGAAMHSPRAQADKKRYQLEIKRVIEEYPGISLRQEQVEDLLFETISHSDEGFQHRIIGQGSRRRCIALLP